MTRVLRRWFQKNGGWFMRLYMTVAVTITHVVYTSYWFIYFDLENGPLCAWIEVLILYPTMVEFLFIISVNCVLLHKVYSSVRRSCYHYSRSKSTEVLFVAIHFVPPHSLLWPLWWGLLRNQGIGHLLVNAALPTNLVKTVIAELHLKICLR